MPTYEYNCTECGHEEEQLLKVSEASGFIECPKCGAKAFKGVGGGSGLIFKGEGWTKKFHNTGGK